MKKNFLITTGGSGGHVIPATILFDHLKNIADVIISIDKRGLRYLDVQNYKIEVIDTPKLDNILFLPINLIKIFILIIKSFLILKKKKIEKIFSTGGYMSLPLILAAQLLNIKIYLVEPNQVLGRANKFFLKSCENIFCYTNEIKNFPEKFRNKMVIINSLVKKKIYDLNLNQKKKDIFTILVVGGSQGASVFDKNLKDVIINVSKKNLIRILHQTNEKIFLF